MSEDMNSQSPYFVIELTPTTTIHQKSGDTHVVVGPGMFLDGLRSNALFCPSKEEADRIANGCNIAYYNGHQVAADKAVQAMQNISF